MRIVKTRRKKENWVFPLCDAWNFFIPVSCARALRAFIYFRHAWCSFWCRETRPGTHTFLHRSSVMLFCGWMTVLWVGHWFRHLERTKNEWSSVVLCCNIQAKITWPAFWFVRSWDNWNGRLSNQTYRSVWHDQYFTSKFLIDGSSFFRRREKCGRTWHFIFM